MLRLLLIALLIAPPCGALAFSSQRPQISQWPLVEFPFNTHNHYAWPSMQQSLMVSSSFYQTIHTVTERKLQEAEKPRWVQRLTIAGIDLISFYLPLGSAWLHEEWHRSVMTHRHIRSQNDVYKFQLFKDVIAVSHVDDDDLIRLKRDFPAEQVRLSAAGIEAQTEQNLYLEKARFFDRSPSWDDVILWTNAANSWAYIQTCNDKDSTERLHQHNEDDGEDISKRDFTGFDCISWVYDLFRPHEKYEDRGLHPSGIGINRYRTLDDLTDEEKSFLRKQQYLGLLNLVDPFLLGFNEFYSQFGGERIVWNAKLQHFLTSFGYDVDAVLFLKRLERNYLFKLHNYFNNKRYFPGLSLELYKWPLRGNFLATWAFSIWEQPVGHSVQTNEGFIGGAFETSIHWTGADSWQPFIYGSIKDRGWKAGHVELDKGWTLGTGISAVF